MARSFEMRSSGKALAALAGLMLLLGISVLAASKKQRAGKIGTMEESKRALHALNRLTFGPRPGEAQQVKETGVERWIEQQLHPEQIDDSRLEARLAPLLTLKMSTSQMIENFPPPDMVRAVADGKQSMPSDPAKRAIYEDALAQYRNKQERKNEKADNANGTAASPGADNPKPVAASVQDNGSGGMTESQREAKMYAELKTSEILDLSPAQRYAAILKMSPEERLAFGRSLKNEQQDQVLTGLTPQQRETLMAMANPQQVVISELQAGKILRAAYSERQLQEVMTDFWFNHFNVFINKGPDREMITAYERDVIRPRAMGKFRDLLVATAESPAMLFYLDNWQSEGPNSDVATGRGPRRANQGARPRRPNVYVDPFGRVQVRGGGANPPPQRRPPPNPTANGQKKQRNGLNENYAREIMELHTLGVDGGYTQKDVTELAKILTGWTIQQPRQGGGFTFNERMHEPGNKIFLGKVFREDGQNEGLKAIEMLSQHPSTARFISRKLAMRFVADDPPSTLVDRMTQTFLDSDGDIREVLSTMLHSPEFWAAEDYRAKVKTPLEFVVSAIRATATDISNALPLAQALNRMGMPLYGMQPPTGYSMKADAWVNSSALLDRMNFALALGAGKMRGSQAEPALLMGQSPPTDTEAALDMLEGDLLNGDVTKQTHAVIEKQLVDPQVTGRKLDDPAKAPNYGVIAGLILGSPEFQKR